jgi:hypothetical protein
MTIHTYDTLQSCAWNNNKWYQYVLTLSQVRHYFPYIHISIILSSVSFKCTRESYTQYRIWNCTYTFTKQTKTYKILNPIEFNISGTNITSISSHPKPPITHLFVCLALHVLVLISSSWSLHLLPYPMRFLH